MGASMKSGNSITQKEDVMRKVFAAAVLMLVGASCFARDITFSWTHSTSGGVLGYKIYCGMASGGPYDAPGFPVTTGYVNTYTVTHVPPGQYYCVMTAFDANGESSYSTETSATLLSNCDINGDGSVNVLDYQILANVILLRITCPFESCDVNRDGVVNTLDLQKVVNAILGTATCPY